MYNFIDTTEALEGTSLPSEALKINGEYIENLIEGYRTLTVEGREALSPEITTIETGARDGSTLKGKRYPARTIRITYQLIAATSEDFRAAYNQLASILDVEDAQLIFNDETDKFFIGTPSRIGEVAPGKNAVVGEFEILCLDPFKYSVMEYSAVPNEGESSIMVNYNGTYKSYPKLEAEFFNEDDVNGLTGNGDCGYVAFFNENEKIIQIGDPDEKDSEEAYPASQTLINQTFQSSSSWGTAVQNLWRVNDGITSSSAVEQAGDLGMSYLPVTPDPALKKSQVLLTAVSRADNPYFHYEIIALETRRSESEVQVTVTVNTRLDNENSYFADSGYSVKGIMYLGGQPRSFYIKRKNVGGAWYGTRVHATTVFFKIPVDKSTSSLNGTFQVVREDTYGKAGTLATTTMKGMKITNFTSPEPSVYFLSAKDYGTGSNWHGPSITRTIPAAAAGDVGATNCTLNYMQKMCIGSGKNDTNQLGAFQVLLVSGSGSSRKIVAGVNVYKGGSGKTANLRFYVNNEVKETVQIDLSHSKSRFDLSKASTIKKSGRVVLFDICGIKKGYQASQIAETPVTEITFTFTKFGTSPALEYNALSWVKFVKNNCDMYKDVPNKFSANDVVEADCNTGEIFLNGASTPSLGALGNDWEEFCLTPGINQIGFSYSDWVDEAYAPAFKVKYREVFL